ncbi:MAG: pyridoxal-dependent decarboxylase [Anaerolineaceae bacterium]|nr:pyridoxal-dependent decarboxylase [Anaerolineaceae bacterium]
MNDNLQMQSPPSPEPQLHMSADEFRQHGYALIDWIAEYLDHSERYPVQAQVQPGEIAARLPDVGPEWGEDFANIIADFESDILPGITHWHSPNFFNYFAISATGPSILGELLTAALNVNGMLWLTSPAATELEGRVTDWLRRWLQLPDSFQGIITDTASISSLLAMAAAREALDRNIRSEGVSGRDLPRLCAYTSEQAHSSITKAGLALGIGQENIRLIEVDADYRLRTDALTHAVQADSEAGHLPFFVAATIGTTSTTSVDPIPQMAQLCKRHQLWLHVDAAYAGVVALLDEHADLLQGCEQADSIVTNPHKWLFTNVDCSVFWLKRPNLLKRAFSVVPQYLQSAGEINNYMDWGVQLGRRFRALKLWFVLRYYGRRGLAHHIREHIRLARLLADWIDGSPHFERLAPVPFSTVCFRYAPPHTDESEKDELNRKMHSLINESGAAFISQTVLNDRFTLRVAIGNIQTQEKHIRALWQLLQDTAAQVTS